MKTIKDNLVLKKGYGLACDVDGVLFVYANKEAKA